MLKGVDFKQCLSLAIYLYWIEGVIHKEHFVVNDLQLSSSFRKTAFFNEGCFHFADVFLCINNNVANKKLIHFLVTDSKQGFRGYIDVQQAQIAI